jgi:hypothetical protein
MNYISPNSPAYYLTSVTKDRRIINFLKQEGYSSSLEKLRRESDRRGHQYSLWDHHPNVRLLTSEGMFMQRLHYTHQNPIRLGLVQRAEEYKYSSARIWNRTPLEDEPLMVNIDKLKWRLRRSLR